MTRPTHWPISTAWMLHCGAAFALALGTAAAASPEQDMEALLSQTAASLVAVQIPGHLWTPKEVALKADQWLWTETSVPHQVEDASGRRLSTSRVDEKFRLNPRDLVEPILVSDQRVELRCKADACIFVSILTWQLAMASQASYQERRRSAVWHFASAQEAQRAATLINEALRLLTSQTK